MSRLTRKQPIIYSYLTDSYAYEDDVDDTDGPECRKIRFVTTPRNVPMDFGHDVSTRRKVAYTVGSSEVYPSCFSTADKRAFRQALADGENRLAQNRSATREVRYALTGALTMLWLAGVL